MKCKASLTIFNTQRNLTDYCNVSYLQVVWRILFDRGSSSETGTLYQAKNFLNPVNCPAEPMDNPDAAYELLSDYTDALIIACYDMVKQNVGRSSALGPEQEELWNRILDDIVDNFAIPDLPDIPTQSNYKCMLCSKTYKHVKSFRRHVKEKHNEENDTANNEKTQMEDRLKNYSCTALSLGILAKNFTAARKLGDGKRIIRLYKFLLLFFKLESRNKYAFYSLYTSSQVYHLLPPKIAHELVWNRTTNCRGQIDTNVENDRTCEHHVKSFKMDCKEFHGKVTSKSIHRASCSYTGINQLMETYKKEICLKMPSGKHINKDTQKDVEAFAKQFINHKLFMDTDGRYHNTFSEMGRNLLSRLDISEMFRKKRDLLLPIMYERH